VTSPSLDPMVSRRKLRSELRRIRVGLGLKQAEVAGRLFWSPSKLGRIESGEVTISITDLKALLAEYGVAEPDRVQELVTLAGAARRAHRQRSEWEDWRGVASDPFLKYLDFESLATAIRSFEPTVVPGLLQVEPYIREITRVALERDDEDRLERFVELRKRRQELVFDEEGVIQERYFVLDESALRRMVGGPAVMRHQLEHLVELARSDGPDLTIRVVPFEFGLHPRWQTPYVIIELPTAEEAAGVASADGVDEPGFAVDVDQYVLFLENSRGSLVIQEKEKGGREVLEYLRQFLTLTDQLDRSASLAVIERALKELPEA
jgi:transcriptional regulator with XRE-family HTH domain